MLLLVRAFVVDVLTLVTLHHVGRVREDLEAPTDLLATSAGCCRTGIAWLDEELSEEATAATQNLGVKLIDAAPAHDNEGIPIFEMGEMAAKRIALCILSFNCFGLSEETLGSSVSRCHEGCQ